jgi:hypothetical protein
MVVRMNKLLPDYDQGTVFRFSEDFNTRPSIVLSERLPSGASGCPINLVTLDDGTQLVSKKVSQWEFGQTLVLSQRPDSNYIVKIVYADRGSNTLYLEKLDPLPVEISEESDDEISMLCLAEIPLPEAVVTITLAKRSLLLQLAKAVAECHDYNAGHGDLKFENFG